MTQATGTELTVVDAEALARARRRHGEDGLGRAIAAFVSGASLGLAQARAALELGQLPRLERCARAVAESAAGLGAREVEELAGWIADLAAAGKGEDLEILLGDLEGATERARRVLRGGKGS